MSPPVPGSASGAAVADSARVRDSGLEVATCPECGRQGTVAEVAAHLVRENCLLFGWGK